MPSPTVDRTRWLICTAIVMSIISAPAFADDLLPRQKLIVGDMVAANAAVKHCGSKLNPDAIITALRDAGLAMADDRVRLYLIESNKEYEANVVGTSWQKFCERVPADYGPNSPTAYHRGWLQ